MQLNMSKTREKYPLSPRKIIKKTLTAFIGWSLLALLGVGILVGLKTGMRYDAQMASDLMPILPLMNKAFWIIAILWMVLVLGEYFYQRWYYAVYYYELNDDHITIKKGPITPTEINVPYERFQDVYVDQDILDRLFGLYDVHLSSATYMSGMEAHIDGLTKEAASALRDELLNIVKNRIKKAK